MKYSYIRDLPLEEVTAILQNRHKLQVKNLKILDLTVPPLQSCAGIYLFFDEHSTCQYIGKTTHSSFLETIISHFDTREKVSPNYLLRKALQQTNKIKNLGQGFDLLSTFWLLLVPVIPADITMINKLEKLLRDTRMLNPCLNALDNGIDFDKQQLLFHFTESWSESNSKLSASFSVC